MRPSDPKYRPDKVEPPAPKVYDADGVEIRVGDTVWTLKDARELEVTGLYPERDSFPVNVKEHKNGAYIFSGVEPSDLTHQRPVLDSDGVPINKGDTVWLTGEPEYSWTVTHVSERHVGGYCNEDGSDLDMHSKSLTHTKPEPTDSLERIADEIDRLREDVAQHLGDYLYDEDGNDSIQFSMELVAKRCRALAERERGE